MIKTKVKQPSSTLSTSNSIEIPKEAYDKIYDDLLIAINTENFSLIKRFLILLRRQPTIITYLPKLTTLLQLANDKLISWCNSLQVDDTIEVYSRIDQKWFEAKITFVDKDKQVYKKIAVNTINTDSHSQKDSDSYGIGGSGSDGNSSSNSAGNSDGNSSNDNRNSTSNSNGDSTSTNYGISYSASNVLGLRVHYLGWGDKFDDYFLIDDKEINPKNTLIGVTASKKSKKKVPTVVVEVVDDSKSIGNGAIPETNGYTRNGYNRRNRASCNGFVGVNRSNSSNSIANTSLLNSNGLATTTLDVNTNDNSTGSAGSVATTTETQTMEEATDLSVVPTVDTIPTKGSKTGKKRKASNAVPDRNEWICSNCGTLDSENGSDLVLCDGPCLRSFHINCLTNEEAKVLHK